MERISLFVDVILPLSLPNLYTYRIPYELNDTIKVGQRVVVQLGKSKLYTAIIKTIHQQPPKNYEAKYIQSVLDVEPILNEQQLKLWDWICSYYICNPGDVMTAALPSGFRLNSETKIILSNAKIDDYSHLSDKEFLIVQALELQEILTLNEIEQIVAQKSVYGLIKSLLDKNVIHVHEELKERYKPKLVPFIKLHESYFDEKSQEELCKKLEKKAYKQLEVLIAYLSLNKNNDYKWIKKADILKTLNTADTAINTLIKKNIFEQREQEVTRLVDDMHNTLLAKGLNEQQKNAELKIIGSFKEKEVVLLHGVTSGGKTEVYIQLIQQYIAQGKQILYMLPEIALTTQIVNRLKAVFGNSVKVYHSKFNENERVEIWNTVLNDKQNNSPSIVIGARSALFLPFNNLGLIIVDEEHDSSYKQYDPAPRYNARDSAIFLATVHKAKVLLGSATPSIESYFNAQTNKYGLVEITERFGGVQMPLINVVDIKEAARKKLMKSHFSPALVDGIELALKNKEQVILFQNRRGFAPLLECRTCAWVPQCKNCDVSLTYHKIGNQLRCHYCGYSISVPQQCEACGDTNLSTKGFGTEKIEDELSIYFPKARIARMDLDSTRAKYAYKQLINDFETHAIDILVGTQMVTKGLDFANVALVGILNADSLFNFPDFRAYERSYQLMAQVSGRAGRKNKQGQVIIQTYNPEHAVIKDVVHNDYQHMYTSQLLDRKQFNYPPYCRIIEVTIKHKDADVLNSGAKEIADILKKQLGGRILGPEFPLVPRIKNEYLKTILIKVERETSTAQVKTIINSTIVLFRNNPIYKYLRYHIDVDPM